MGKITKHDERRMATNDGIVEGDHEKKKMKKTKKVRM